MDSSDKKASLDSVEPSPRTDFDGPVLPLDFPELQVGVAEYDEGPTGCTVFHFPEGVTTAVDTRGGMVGAIEVEYGWHHAICFAGGSLFGFEAILGTRAELFARGGYDLDRLPMVTGAIVWDWSGRDNAIYPDAALGRAALRSARQGRFAVGPRGAGRNAGCGGSVQGLGSESTGQGGAFRQVGQVKIAVFTVVNALGAVINREGRVVRGHLDRETGQRHHHGDRLAQQLAAADPRLWRSVYRFSDSGTPGNNLCILRPQHAKLPDEKWKADDDAHHSLRNHVPGRNAFINAPGETKVLPISQKGPAGNEHANSCRHCSTAKTHYQSQFAADFDLLPQSYTKRQD